MGLMVAQVLRVHSQGSRQRIGDSQQWGTWLLGQRRTNKTCPGVGWNLGGEGAATHLAVSSAAAQRMELLNIYRWLGKMAV